MTHYLVMWRLRWLYWRGITAERLRGVPVNLLSASWLLAVLLGMALPALGGRPALAETLAVGEFSRMAPGDTLPDSWELGRPNKNFPPTRFRLEADGGTAVVRADADHSMAGLSRKVYVDVRRLPYLCWRWKIAAPRVNADLRTKQGDDYAARLYVLFDYSASHWPLGTRLKLGALRGLFSIEVPAEGGSQLRVGQPLSRRHRGPNAYTDRAMMGVLQSGTGEAGRWVGEVRNLAADFRRAFGWATEMTMVIKAIGLFPAFALQE